MTVKDTQFGEKIIDWIISKRTLIFLSASNLQGKFLNNMENICAWNEEIELCKKNMSNPQRQIVGVFVLEVVDARSPPPSLG